MISSYLGALALGLAMFSSPVAAQELAVGDEVCVEGYLMDFFCIGRGTLFDNPTVGTLSAQGPVVHSVHCLIDVPQCIGTPFEILLPNTNTSADAENAFIRGWRLDDATKETAVALAKAEGICTDCTGGAMATIERGFYIALTATIADLGNAATGTPPSISAMMTDSVTLGSPETATCTGGSAYPPAQTAQAPDDTPVAPTTGEGNPNVTELATGLTLQTVDNGDNTATFTVTYQGEGWIGLGVSPDGQMVGSQAVIALPDDTTGTPVQMYDLNSKATAGAVPSAAADQILTSSSLSRETTQDGGVTTLTFTVPYDATTGYSVSSTGDTGFIWAYGSSNQLAYHASRGAFTSAIGGGGGGGGNNEGGGTNDSAVPEVEMPATPPESGLQELEAGILTLQSVDNGDNTATYTIVYQGEGWVGLGVSPSGQMVPTQAVIGIFGEGTPVIYNLDSRSPDGVTPAPEDEQILLSAECMQENGITTMTFTTPLDSTTPFSISTGETGFIYAYGENNQLAYHKSRGVFSSSLTSGPQVGDTFCVEGYLMDLFCINRGTLFDNPDVVTLSLEGPPIHSVKCLIDVPDCLASPFEILLPPLPGQDEFQRGWRLDDEAKEEAVALAKLVGSCSACSGSQINNFYISMTATMQDVGTADRPPLISVAGMSIVAGDPEPTCDVLTRPPVFPSSGEREPVSTPAGTISLNPGFTLKTMDNGNNTATFTLEYEGEGWVGLGVGSQMVGSQAVIGLPDSGEPPMIYDLTSQSTPGIVAASSDDQILLSSSVEQVDGVTILTYTVPLDAATPFSVSSSGSTGYVWAYGSSNELAYHAARGTISAAIGEGGGAAPDPDDPLQVGDQVCVEGFLMDQFCINRGTLFDNPTVETQSAEGPAVHTVHCLIDVPQCIGTPFEILLPNMAEGAGETGGNDAFIRGWLLDDSTKDAAVALAKAEGICTDCGGGGSIERGFYIALTAEIVDLGDDLLPPLITAVGDVSVGSPDALTCAGGSAYPPPPSEGGDRGNTPSGIITLAPGFTMQTVDNGDTATFTLNYIGEGWVGLGISSSGAMVGSQAVIALPDSGEAPMIYDLTSQAPAGVVPAPDDQQILTDATVTQVDGITTLEFTVPLEANTPFFVSASGDTGYIYAYGSSNELAFHARRGAIRAPLQGEATRIDASSRYKAHGWLMAIAWGILVPLAVGASMLRDLLPGQGTFFKIHRALNTLALVTVIVAFALAIDAVQLEGLPHFSENKHRTTGLVIVVFALAQGLMGYCRPHLPAPPPADADADGAAGDDAEQGDLVPKAERPKAEEKSTARKAFEVGHRSLGFALLATAWWNCYTGIEFFNLKFPDMADPNLTNVFLGITLGLAGVIFLVYAGNTVRKMDKSS